MPALTPSAATPESPHDPRRRQLLTAAAAAPLLLTAGCGSSDASAHVSDVTQMERLPVARMARPADPAAVRTLLREWPGPVSIGGGRFSMGGQIAAEDSLHLDLRGMNRLLWLDPQARTVRAQAGMTWRDLQDHLDPHDLSVAVMQSYSNFTLGGSVSVNCHGRYVGKGPIANSVRALQLATADGTLRELSPSREPELFAAAIGSYGGLGVVTEVELALDDNALLRRDVEWVRLEEYPHWFRTCVLEDAGAVLHNADLAPPDFDRPLAITWRRSDAQPTDPRRLVPRDADYRGDRWLLWMASELAIGPTLRQRHQERQLRQEAPVVWRNLEASLDVASLEPASRRFSTYLLQEYFVPVARFHVFALRLSEILRRNAVEALNVSIRHAPRDTVSLLRWAADEVFCFVLYHKQANNLRADRAAARWTRELIEAALDCGGRYYLPYRLHATPGQFARAYPEAPAFAALKRRIDPQNRFRNRLWQTYLPELS